MPSPTQSAAAALAMGPVPRLPQLEHPDFCTRWVGASPQPPQPIFVYADVLEELCYLAHKAEADSAALLTGAWCVGPMGPFVEVDGFCDSGPLRGELPLLNFLRARRERLLDATDALVLGVCISRAHSEARLDPTELIALNTFFARSCHVALLLDAATDRLAWLSPDEQGSWRNVGCYLVDGADAAGGVDEMPAIV